MLEILASRHKEWVLIVNSFGEFQIAEDIVQDMYLKLYDGGHLDKIIIDGKVSTTGVWLTLRSIYIDIKRKERFFFTELEDCYLEADVKDIEFEKRYDELLYQLTIGLNELDKDDKYPYNKELFKLYASTDMSLQDIENEVGISKRSVHYTIDKCRKKLKSKLENLYNEIN